VLFVYVTCKNAREAEEIGVSLVKKRLASCAVVLPKAKSFFFWKGKIKKASEALLLLKASDGKRNAIEKEIAKLHSYETPGILFFQPKASRKFEKWVDESS